MSHKTVFKNIALIVSGVYLFTNVAFAHSPQTSLWKERKSSYQIASAVLSPGTSFKTNNFPFPALRSVFANGSTVSSAKKKLPTRFVSQLPDSFFAHVNIKSVHSAQGPQIVILEDVHMNLEAQNHISQAIQSLSPVKQGVLVAVEGAAGGFVFDEFKSLAPEAVKEVADSFLASSDIGGPSHAGYVMAPENRNLTFWGVDDRTAYTRNVSAYKESSKIKSALMARTNEKKNELARRKEKIFSTELKLFDQAVESYRAGTLPLSSYVKMLSKYGEPTSMVFEMFVQALAMEEKIDFTVVESQRRVVIEKLVRSLGEKDLNHLIEMSLAYQQGTLTFGDYYSQLRGICQKAGVDLAETPAFNTYIRYVLLADGIDADKLFRELTDLESRAYMSLADNKEQTELVAAARGLYLTRELMNFGLTPDQWAEYRSVERSDDMAAFEDFYRSADIRSQTMVKQTLAKAKSSNSALTVLVAGGFHTEEMAQLLKDQNVSYVVATPKITKTDGLSGTSYLSVFDREKTQLDEIFSGSKLYVAPPVAGARAPLGASGLTSGGILAFMATVLSHVQRTGGDPEVAVEQMSHLSQALRSILYHKSGTNVEAAATTADGKKILLVYSKLGSRGLGFWKRLFWKQINTREFPEGRIRLTMYTERFSLPQLSGFSLPGISMGFSPNRRPLIAFNWKEKMDSKTKVDAFFDELKKLDLYTPNRDVVIVPSDNHLERVGRALQGMDVVLGAQDIGRDLLDMDAKAATGKINAASLKDEGVTYVIIGHSEIRQQDRESNEVTRLKVKAALKAGLTPILCIGERIDTGRPVDAQLFRGHQLKEGLAGFSPAEIEKVVIAYEPVWAIGTGRTPTLEEIQEAHKEIRTRLGRLDGMPNAEKIRILYGGSVNEKNVAEITALQDVDGVLVGGAGLVPANAKAIAEANEELPIATTNLDPRHELSLLKRVLAKVKQALAGAAIALPLVTVISDQQGGMAKFDALILESIRQAAPQQIPDEFKQLNPDQTINAQLSKFGVTLEGLRGKLFIKNLGDLMDRGDHGVKVYRRSAELMKAGVSDFVVGNHDIWMFMNIAKFHLPWYDGYNFYGDKAAEALVARHRGEDPQGEGANDPAWWASKLADYTKFHQGKQKSRWAALDLKIGGDYKDKGKKRVKESGLFGTVRASLNDSEKRLWERLTGYFLVDVQTGTRAVGEFSLKRWEELLADFKSARKTLSQPSPVTDAAWDEAIALVEHEIIPEVRADIEAKIQAGEWWVTVFEALNYHNYTSPEWWAKDWIFHEGWGPNVLAELNQETDGTTLTPWNYLSSGDLQEIAGFYKSHFTLYTRDIYQNTYVHALLPVDPKTGEFFFSYKGVEYRGPSVWEGMDAIASDIRNAKNLKEMHAALTLVNSWYADNTTQAKPKDVVGVIRKIGVEKLMSANGINRLFFGHIPIADFLKSDAKNDDRTVADSNIANRMFFVDFGMDKKYEGRGGMHVVNQNGIHKIGYARPKAPADSRPVVNAPIEDVDGNVLVNATPFAKADFLHQLEKDLEARISQLTELSTRSQSPWDSWGVGIPLIIATLGLSSAVLPQSPSQNPNLEGNGVDPIVLILLALAGFMVVGVMFFLWLVNKDDDDEIKSNGSSSAKNPPSSRPIPVYEAMAALLKDLGLTAAPGSNATKIQNGMKATVEALDPQGQLVSVRADRNVTTGLLDRASAQVKVLNKNAGLPANAQTRPLAREQLLVAIGLVSEYLNVVLDIDKISPVVSGDGKFLAIAGRKDGEQGLFLFDLDEAGNPGRARFQSRDIAGLKLAIVRALNARRINLQGSDMRLSFSNNSQYVATSVPYGKNVLFVVARYDAFTGAIGEVRHKQETIVAIHGRNSPAATLQDKAMLALLFDMGEPQTSARVEISKDGKTGRAAIRTMKGTLEFVTADWDAKTGVMSNLRFEENNQSGNVNVLFVAFAAVLSVAAVVSAAFIGWPAALLGVAIIGVAGYFLWRNRKRDAANNAAVEEEEGAIREIIKDAMGRAKGKAIGQPLPVEIKSVPTEDLSKDIKFGTAGWRAGHRLAGQTGEVPSTIDTSVTIDNVGRVAQAIANVLKKRGADQRVAVGYDVRTMGREFAVLVVEVLVANGIKADLIDQVNPSPVIAEATRKGQESRYTLGVAITASHNEVFRHLGPDVIWSGMKVFEDGFPGGDALTGEIAKEANNKQTNGTYQWVSYDALSDAGGLTFKGVDLLSRSNERLARAFEFGLLKEKISGYLNGHPGFSLLIDSMHGATLAAAKVLLGLGIAGEHLNTDPVSAGTHPRNLQWSPNPTNPAFYPEFSQKLKSGQLGLLFDGDGDRAVVRDLDGSEITPNMLGVVFAHYLYTHKGVRGKIVRTLPTSRMLDLLARKLNVELVETPVGSKNFAPFGDDVIVAVEESGHIFFKINGELFVDSAVAEAVLVLDIMANTGKTLGQYYQDVAAELEGGLVYNRGSVAKSLVDEPFKAHLLDLRRDRPEVFAKALAAALGKELRKDPKGNIADKYSFNTVDSTGILVLFADDTWAMYRLSGTDGSVRIYGEEKTAEKLAAQEKAVQDVLVGLKPISFADINAKMWVNSDKVVFDNPDKKASYQGLVSERFDVYARRLAEALDRKLLLKEGKTQVAGTTYEISPDGKKAIVRFHDSSWVYLEFDRIKMRKSTLTAIASDDSERTSEIALRYAEILSFGGQQAIDNSQPTQDVLPKMLAAAANLIGVPVVKLQQSRIHADEAVDVYNAHVGGLFKILHGRNVKDVSPTPAVIPTEASKDGKLVHLRSAKAGELGYLIFGAGRATRMKLPNVFDTLGIAGIVEWFLVQFQRFKPGAAEGDVEANLSYFDQAIQNAKQGRVSKDYLDAGLKDLTMVQRQLLQLWYDTVKLATENPEAGVSVEDVVKGLSFTVVVNHSNRDAVQRQLAALNFPGKIKVMEQPEVGGYVINPDGSLTWKEDAVFPEGHGQPFIAMAQTVGHVYELNNNSKDWTEVNDTLVNTLEKNGVKYFMFAQVNDLHLLSNMASVERWETARKQMDDGAEFVMEMVANSLRQKGGGTFLNAAGYAEMRDTLAMKRPQLDAVTIPKSLSRMFYFGQLEALKKVNWNSIPAYLNIREANGQVVFTRELYSGDASSALKGRTMEQPGVAINTFKDRGRADVAQAAYHRQNDQSGFRAFLQGLLRVSGVVLAMAAITAPLSAAQNVPDLSRVLPGMDKNVEITALVVGILAVMVIIVAVAIQKSVAGKSSEADGESESEKPTAAAEPASIIFDDVAYIKPLLQSTPDRQALADYLYQNAPKGSVFNASPSVLDNLFSSGKGLIDSSDPQTQTRSLELAVAYLQQAKKALAYKTFEHIRQQNRIQWRQSGVTVLHIGQNPDLLDADIANLRLMQNIIYSDNRAERPHDLIVIVHPAAQSKTIEIRAITTAVERNTAILSSSEITEINGVRTYNQALDLAVQKVEGLDASRLSIIKKLRAGQMADVKLVTYDRTPGWMIAEGDLQAVWTLVLSLTHLGWVTIPMEDVIKGARLAAQAA